MTFEFLLIIESIPKMLAGLGITLQLLFLSSFFGLCLGIIILLMRISGRWYLSLPASIYIYFFRGTPLLVQIFVIYHGFPQFEFIRESIFWPILREPFAFPQPEFRRLCFRNPSGGISRSGSRNA
jgi:polar amino acid transport system permease protein